eukprot:CAMPEP_0172720610 /NCGR_PEP_ID=MMETSP1074-20121228/77281_1 /TAXON_ID=2916 /ORGANISM="Ceratium fusus, Strain PA161109" /LENGTH=439 /DNA_ID=CAMNT_0013546149 /DNA_START=71 /DNA_END=1390 /DNA_ORIENTATION=+
MTLSKSSLMMIALFVLSEAIRDEKVDLKPKIQSDEKTLDRVDSARSNCPYGDAAASRKAGTKSFNCHGFATGPAGDWGASCPDLQAARLKTVRAFQMKHHASFMEGVGGYTLSPVFDKSEAIRGDETYEELVKLHIKGLLHPGMATFEDKILLKQFARVLGIPTTKMHFGAHAAGRGAEDEYDRANFIELLKDLCDSGEDDFFIKATHLAWSKGQKIVLNWQEQCRHNKENAVNEYADFAEQEVLNVQAGAADEHLQQLIPGVTVESLFKTGGDSNKPLEAKVQVVWGKVHHMFFFGEDDRGCKVNVGSWQVYGDKTGWDLNGIIQPGGGNDALGDRILEEAFQPMVDYAEKFAKGVQADFMRVDFFLRQPANTGGDWMIEMNECESVSGMRHTLERLGLGAIWRDGYVMSRLKMTGEKYTRISDNTQADRDKLELDKE